MRLLIAVSLVSLLSQAVHAAGVERFQAYVRSTQSVSGSFEQKVYDKSRKLVQESTGSFQRSRSPS